MTKPVKKRKGAKSVRVFIRLIRPTSMYFQYVGKKSTHKNLDLVETKHLAKAFTQVEATRYAEAVKLRDFTLITVGGEYAGAEVEERKVSDEDLGDRPESVPARKTKRTGLA